MPDPYGTVSVVATYAGSSHISSADDSSSALLLRPHLQLSLNVVYLKGQSLALFCFSYIHCWTAGVDTGQWAEPSSLCWWHSDLRFLFTDAVFVRGTTAPYFRMHWRCRQLVAVKQAPLNTSKTEIIWLSSRRRSVQLPQQPFRVVNNHRDFPRYGCANEVLCRQDYSCMLCSTAPASKHSSVSSWSVSAVAVVLSGVIEVRPWKRSTCRDLG